VLFPLTAFPREGGKKKKWTSDAEHLFCPDGKKNPEGEKGTRSESTSGLPFARRKGEIEKGPRPYLVARIEGRPEKEKGERGLEPLLSHLSPSRTKKIKNRRSPPFLILPAPRVEKRKEFKKGKKKKARTKLRA